MRSLRLREDDVTLPVLRMPSPPCRVRAAKMRKMLIRRIDASFAWTLGDSLVVVAGD